MVANAKHVEDCTHRSSMLSCPRRGFELCTLTKCLASRMLVESQQASLHCTLQYCSSTELGKKGVPSAMAPGKWVCWWRAKLHALPTAQPQPDRQFAEHTRNEFHLTLSIRGMDFIAGWAYAEMFIKNLMLQALGTIRFRFLQKIQKKFHAFVCTFNPKKQVHLDLFFSLSLRCCF